MNTFTVPESDAGSGNFSDGNGPNTPNAPNASNVPNAPTQ